MRAGENSNASKTGTPLPGKNELMLKRTTQLKTTAYPYGTPRRLPSLVTRATKRSGCCGTSIAWIAPCRVRSALVSKTLSAAEGRLPGTVRFFALASAPNPGRSSLLVARSPPIPQLRTRPGPYCTDCTAVSAARAGRRTEIRRGAAEANKVYLRSPSLGARSSMALSTMDSARHKAVEGRAVALWQSG